MPSGDKVTFAKSGKMRVIYTGDTKEAATTKGEETVKLENAKEYKCTEKEYHSGLFVRMQVVAGVPGKHVKVKRSELQKV